MIFTRPVTKSTKFQQGEPKMLEERHWINDAVYWLPILVPAAVIWYFFGSDGLGIAAIFLFLSVPVALVLFFIWRVSDGSLLFKVVYTIFIIIVTLWPFIGKLPNCGPNGEFSWSLVCHQTSESGEN